LISEVLMSKLTSCLILVALALVILAVSLRGVASQAENAKVVPLPAVDEPPGTRSSEIAVLAGGCFWGVQGVYQHLKGVTSAVSGYAGGEQSTADYERVSTGGTGHAEAVQITFDPRVITYGRILQVFFSVVHDPTQLNRQGPDVGTQYRSAIFPMNPEQGNVAKAFIAQLNQARTFGAAIVTKIEPGRSFYRAEAYHQDFLERNPTQPYIVMHDLPKIDNLKRMFPDLYSPKPVLVSSTK
jgi:peptide-methionine (S)-S-oxide reductase